MSAQVAAKPPPVAAKPPRVAAKPSLKSGPKELEPIDGEGETAYSSIREIDTSVKKVCKFGK